MNKNFQYLVKLLSRLPGVGPRQATRFAFFVVKQGWGIADELIAALQETGQKIGACPQCFRSIERTTTHAELCIYCKDEKREKNLIAVVEKESDLHNLEKTAAFRGLYHVLGGVVSPLDSESPKRLHLRELHTRVKKLLAENGTCEVILATSSTTEGDTTALYIERVLSPLKDKFQSIIISRLGRGLSLGAELEYADEVTLKNALTNRR